MSAASPLAVIQVPRELVERMGAQAGPLDAYCDERGSWLGPNNGHWQLTVPAWTSLAMG